MFNSLIAFIIAIVISAVAWLMHTLHLSETHVKTNTSDEEGKYYAAVKDASATPTGTSETHQVHFDLVDPECAPEAKLYMIMYGYQIMEETAKHCPENVGNALSCNNCHFNAGNTLGGSNRGISLVGVTEVYPRFSSRDNKMISLNDRLDNCFKRSLNGVPLPEDSIERDALVSYFKWISHEVASLGKYPWLGLKFLDSKHEGDIANGEKVYHKHCSLCHGENGEGSERPSATSIPPLWGNQSFNDGAGMNRLDMASSFIFYNMPLGQPTLTEEEAIDVAAFVVAQPRPHFNPNR